MGRIATVVLILGVTLLVFVGPAAAVDSFFDIFTDQSQTGVAPLPPLQEQLGRMVAGTFLHELGHNLELNHGGSANAADPPMTATVKLSNGSPLGQAAPSSFFDIFFEVGPPPPPFPVDSFFDVFVELDIPGGGPSHLVPLNPGVPNSFFDVFVGDSFFDITYRVEVGPGGGCHELHMHFDCASPLTPFNVHVEPSSNFDSFFDVFFDLQKQPGPPSDPDLSQPIVRITNTGQYLSPPVGTQAATWGMVKSLYRQ